MEETIVAWISMTPLLILYLLIMDGILVAHVLIAKPIILLMKMTCYRKKRQHENRWLSFFESFEDYTYKRIFNM